MMRLHHEEIVDRFELPNALGKPRTIVIRRNEHDRYTWRLIYQDNPVLSDREFEYTWHWFDTAAAARRSARCFMKRLGQ